MLKYPAANNSGGGSFVAVTAFPGWSRSGIEPGSGSDVVLVFDGSPARRSTP